MYTWLFSVKYTGVESTENQERGKKRVVKCIKMSFIYTSFVCQKELQKAEHNSCVYFARDVGFGCTIISQIGAYPGEGYGKALHFPGVLRFRQRPDSKTVSVVAIYQENPNHSYPVDLLASPASLSITGFSR